MSPPDEPASVQHEESRQELYGRPGADRTGTEIGTLLLLVVAIVGGAIAFEEIDHWAQWVVLGGIVATVVGFMIAVSPSRRA